MNLPWLTARRRDAEDAIATVLLTHPHKRHFGYLLSRTSGLRSGRMYPALSRMLEQGWIVDGWEDEAETGGRKPRRFYMLTTKGREALSSRRGQQQKNRG